MTTKKNRSLSKLAFNNQIEFQKRSNVLLIRKLFEEHVNQDDLSFYADFFSKDVLIHGPASNQKIRGLEETRQIDTSYIQAYPGKRFTIEEIFGYGDRVIVRWICRGKHKGKYKGINPKNPLFAIAGLSIYRILKGKIVEVWQYWDRLGLLEQIGEISLQTDPVEPGYYLGLLKSLGMEQYIEKAPILSHRERQCLRCLLDGKTAKETAAIYKLSPRTVESHFEKIKQKLKCTNKRDLFSIAQALEKLNLL